MPHAYPRHVRIARSVQQIIAPELVGVIPKALVTVTNVELSKDLSVAKIYFSVIGTNSATAQTVLDELAGSLRHKLSKELEAKRVPSIVFVADVSLGDLECTVS